ARTGVDRAARGWPRRFCPCVAAAPDGGLTDPPFRPARKLKDPTRDLRVAAGNVGPPVHTSRPAYGLAVSARDLQPGGSFRPYLRPSRQEDASQATGDRLNTAT